MSGRDSSKCPLLDENGIAERHYVGRIIAEAFLEREPVTVTVTVTVTGDR
jgi:hypothetical protein